jgi:hypothetical protein
MIMLTFESRFNFLLMMRDTKRTARTRIRVERTGFGITLMSSPICSSCEHQRTAVINTATSKQNGRLILLFHCVKRYLISLDR